MKEEFPIEMMCKLINLPRRTYYDTINWEKSSRERKAEEFSALVEGVFQDHNRDIGSSQIQRILKEQSVNSTQQTVWRHMKKLGLLEDKMK